VSPSPVGAVLELVLGVVFLAAAVVAARTGSPTRWVVVDLTIAGVALADSAATTADGALRLGLWVTAGAAVCVAAAFLVTARVRVEPPSR